MLDGLGFSAEEVPSRHPTGIDVVQTETLLRKGNIRAGIVTANFQNPTGSVIPDEKKRELVELFNKYEVPLIEDDIYGDLPFSSERPRALKSFDQTGNVIYCTSFSKNLAPGFRVGWLIGGKYHSDICSSKLSLNMSCSSLPCRVLAEYLSLNSYQRHLRKLSKRYQENTAIIGERVLSRFPSSTELALPLGGFLLWIKLPDGISSLEVYHEALAKGVLFCPGLIFSKSNRFDGHLRISAAHPPERHILEAIDLIGSIAAQQVKP